MNGRMSSSMIVLAIIEVLGFASPAQATPISTTDVEIQLGRFSAYVHIGTIMAATVLGTKNPKEEADEIKRIVAEYRKENPLAAIGQAALGGDYAVSLFPSGTTESLTFFFIDPDTGVPTSSGPVVSSVLYEVTADPSSSVFQFLGVSSDSSSNFALPFTIPGFEPFIQATPFDAFGSPIVISGVDGNNVAVGFVVNIAQGEVPEPTTLSLLGLGIGMQAMRRWRVAAVNRR